MGLADPGRPRKSPREPGERLQAGGAQSSTGWPPAPPWAGIRAYNCSARSSPGGPKPEHDLLDALVDTMENKLQVDNVGNEGTVTILFEWTDKETAYRVVDTLTQNFLEGRHAEVALLEETIAILESNAKRLQLQVDTTLDDVERRQRQSRRPRRGARGPGSPWRRTRRSSASRTPWWRAAAPWPTSSSPRSRRLADRNGHSRRRRASSPSSTRSSSPCAKHRRHVAPPRPPTRCARSSSTWSARWPAGAASATPGRRWIPSRRASGSTRSTCGPSTPAATSSSSARSTPACCSASPQPAVDSRPPQAAFKYRYSVVTPPQVPMAPKKPYFALRLVGGLVGGLALAIFVSTMLDIRSTRLLEEWQLQRQLGVPLLARSNRWAPARARGRRRPPGRRAAHHGDHRAVGRLGRRPSTSTDTGASSLPRKTRSRRIQGSSAGWCSRSPSRSRRRRPAGRRSSGRASGCRRGRWSRRRRGAGGWRRPSPRRWSGSGPRGSRCGSSNPPAKAPSRTPTIRWRSDRLWAAPSSWRADCGRMVKTSRGPRDSTTVCAQGSPVPDGMPAATIFESGKRLAMVELRGPLDVPARELGRGERLVGDRGGPLEEHEVRRAPPRAPRGRRRCPSGGR